MDRQCLRLSLGRGNRAAHLHLGGLLSVAVEALGLDGFEALSLLLMRKQQAAHLGHALPPLLCLFYCQSLHAPNQILVRTTATLLVDVHRATMLVLMSILLVEHTIKDV